MNNYDGFDCLYILEDYEEPDPCYGMDEFYISDEQLEALKEGKRLYLTVNAQEYAVVIKREGGVKADNE